MTNSQVFDERVCALGEGPLWHPLRKQLFWFDILGKKMLSKTANSLNGLLKTTFLPRDGLTQIHS